MEVPHSHITIGRLLPYLHGAYNFTVFLFFLCQARTGLKIRKGKILGIPPALEPVRRHRKSGPVLVLAGILGFFAGLFIVYLEEGHVAEHPAHFAFSLLIALLLMLTFFVSRNIKGRDSRWRPVHFAIGILILCAYIVQIFLGLNMILSH